MDREFYKKRSEAWRREGFRGSIRLFRAMALRVPAYKDFLKKHKIRPGNIKTRADFSQVPSLTKDNYLRQYPLEMMVWDGTMKDKKFTFTATSGSTGTPTYFPRDEVLDEQSSVFHELFLNTVSRRKKQSTLVIDCFGMGVWIGGLITYQAFRKIAGRGYPVSVITPGINKKEIFDAITHIGDKFSQIVLCGYPPFIKNILDEGASLGIAWHDYSLKLLFAAEGFGEGFREHVAELAGVPDVAINTANIYGSADLGTMAIETPLSIHARRLALGNPELFSCFFGSISKTPTFAQFNPRFVNFESREGVILCTGYNALPLVRYEIGDHGGVVEYPVVAEALGPRGLRDYMAPQWPFVYIYERADFSTKLYGAIIFPEHIRELMLSESLKERLTGRFTLMTVSTAEQEQSLEVHVELKKEIQRCPDFERLVAERVKSELVRKNAEYSNNYSVLGSKVHPRVVSWPYQHELHFAGGGKQRWVKK